MYFFKLKGGEKRLFIIGKVGVGKSVVGNVII